MTRDLTEKNLVEEAEVFADISNVNLYDGRNVIRPEDLELLSGADREKIPAYSTVVLKKEK